jgi:lysophospholipid acyltransferase (LPLAT)-like uncharacterized protein
VEPASPPPPVPLKHRLLLGAVPVAAGLVRGITRTMTIRLKDPYGRAPSAKPRPSIYAFWHEHQLLAMSYFRNFDIRVLVSRSRDGDYISAALESFGFRTVRSSTSSGQVTALRGLARELKRGFHAAITPDGPRGPRHLAQPGAVFLSALTGLPVVPFGCAVEPAWRLSSWDRFAIPKPWSRAAFVFDEPMAVPAKLDEAAVTRLVAELNARLKALERAAADELGRMGRP